MPTRLKRHLPWALVWVVLTLLGGLLFARSELLTLKNSFDEDSRRAHLLLDQKFTLLDKLLQSLASGAHLTLAGVANASADDRNRADQRLINLHPFIQQIQRRAGEDAFADQLLRTSDVASRQLQKPLMVDPGVTLGPGKTRYWLVLGTASAGVALLVDLNLLPPWQDWPMVRDASPTRVTLAQADRADGSGPPDPLAQDLLVLQAGSNRLAQPHGWHWHFEQAFESPTQTFKLVAHHRVGWSDLPWSHTATWSLTVALVLLALRALLRQRHDQYRTEELLRLGQMGRVNTLGELAVGMVRELGEPLKFAVEANQVAGQLLKSEPPQLRSAQEAVALAATQSGLAFDVVERLRHVVQRPDLSREIERLNLLGATHASLDLLSTEFARLGIVPKLDVQGPDFSVMAAPDALEQIIHNLLINALQALALVPPHERLLTLVVSSTDNASSDKRGQLAVQDSGPGLANNIVTQIFEPFFTTKQGALGLGLSLCDTYASAMGGTLTAYNRMPRGAEFCLRLPLAT